jgi:Short C-terminal domain
MINPFTHRKILKRGRPGRAMIVTMGALDRGATSFNLPMTLQVYVDGITPYEVEDQWMVKAKDTVALSGWIPVKVDPDEPEKVAIDWEPLRERYEQEKAARREALAHGNGFTDANVTIAEPTVINLDAGDAQGADQIQQMLASMGFGADVQQQAAAAFEQAQAQPADGGDDVIGKLERLAALRASGALTDAEFEAQKRRLLGS